MRALVTGATGLIGAHIVRALVSAGHEVCCLVRSSSRRDAIGDLPLTFVVADLTQLDPDVAFGECDVVFHTAAHFAYGGFSSDELHRTAVQGTERLLRACSRQGICKVLVTSSSVVYGYNKDGAIICERPALADSTGEPPYVAAKIAQHKHALALGKALQLDVRFACPTMTVGPTSSRLGPSNGAIVAYLADPIGCTYPGGCNMVCARDVAAGHLLIAEHGVAGESYLLGAGNLTWPQVHQAIAELAGVAPPRVTLNHSAAYLAATAEEVRAALARRPALSSREQAGMVGRYYWYSHAKAAALGYAPEPVRDALIETISWLAASPFITREARTRMRLSGDIYRYRSCMEMRP